MLDRYNPLTYDYKIELVYANLIQNIILKKIINIMSIIISDLDIELKMKISRIKYLESNFSLYKWRLYISLKIILNAML